jgi:hypothetical protein
MAIAKLNQHVFVVSGHCPAENSVNSGQSIATLII